MVHELQHLLYINGQINVSSGGSDALAGPVASSVKWLSQLSGTCSEMLSETLGLGIILSSRGQRESPVTYASVKDVS